MSAVLLAFVVATSTANAATIGSITQLAGTAGCTTDASTPVAGCGTARALGGVSPFFGSHSVALSPDGKNAYAASFTSDAITVFDRSSRTGVLTQKSGRSGCVALTPSAGCAIGRGLIRPTSVAVSPDGRSVYAASIIANSVAVFERNRKTGSLRQKRGSAGCVANQAIENCAIGRALAGADVVAVSPDNKSVYVGTFESDGVASFTRNRATGSITQKAGTAGCIVETPLSGCATGRALNGAEGLTISPDGKSVYVGAAIGNGVAVLRRSTSTGNLSQATGVTGCWAFQAANGCSEGHGLVGADSMQVSPDNKHLYVASGVGKSIAAFRRNRSTGSILQLRGIAGCYAQAAHTLGRCVTGVQLDTPEGIVVSPDGNSVYVGSFFSNAVAVFDRVAYTGTLTQRAGPNGCVVDPATSGCNTGRALLGANGLAISADGRRLYVGAANSSAISVFSRSVPPPGNVKVSVPSRVRVAIGSSVSVPVSCTGSKNRLCPGGISLAQSSSSAARTAARRGGSFSIPSGQRRNVSIAIPSSLIRALRSSGSVRAVASLRVVLPNGKIRNTRQSIVLIAATPGFTGSNPFDRKRTP
ncbi:MAG: beta-propeller fold lactonase family protein [Solirubrobacterales bacterium]